MVAAVGLDRFHGGGAGLLADAGRIVVLYAASLGMFFAA